MPRSLFAKLVAVLLALLAVTSGIYVLLSVATTRLHIEEVSQNLQRSLAADLVKDRALVSGDAIDHDALKKVFDMLMVVNPAIEVYLLDPGGAILAYSAPPDRVRRERVSMTPIRTFLDGRTSFPIRGDDPRSSTDQKIFSVAPILQDGALRGYLYVVLGGELYESVAGMFEASWIMRLGAGVALVSLFLVAIAGILSFNWLTRRLRRLTTQVGAFQAVGPADQTIPAFGDRTRSSDEIGDLSAAFAQMADRINHQVRALEAADIQRRELVTNISHDLRTPLASLQGAIETLQIKEQSLTPDQKRHYLDLAHKHSQRVSRLITDLFELATLDSGDHQPHIEPFSLAELVQDVTQKMHLTAADKNVQLVADMPLDRSPVRGDIGLIERVLTNLADNAVKYTPDGGRISIGVARHGDRVTAHVADTGHGIGEDDRARVFERSFRADKTRSDGIAGAGLGLAIAQRIMELHNGRLEVESEPGAGTTFSFSLPVAAD